MDPRQTPIRATAHSDTAPSDTVETLTPPTTGSPNAPPEMPGTMPQTFGRYRILKKLGEGGMGSVYLAHDAGLDRPVALKVPRFTPEDGPKALERFHREARAAATLAHPNLCPVYDIGELNGTHYLTMAYIEGTSLASALPDGQPLPQRQAATVVHQLASALAYAHRHGVIHRDLKPSNVMLREGGEPVIMDFGLARRAAKEDSRLTRAGEIMGTPAYMSPEQVQGDIEAMGPNCDIYSLGVILYQLLTGRVPFQGTVGSVLAQILTQEPEPPSALRPDLDTELNTICLKAMAKEVGQRFQSMDEMAAALAAYLKAENKAESQAAAARGNRGPAAGGAPARSVRRWWIAVAAGVLATTGLMGVVVYLNTNHGKVKIEVNDPSAEVSIDGQTVRIENLGEPITLHAGEHALVVKRGDVVMETRTFAIKRGENNEPIRVTLLPKPAGAPQVVDRPPPKPVTGEERRKPVGSHPPVKNSLGMELVYIAPGSFEMGSPVTEPGRRTVDSETQHRVTLTKGFYLGTTLVTQAQWRAVFGENPSGLKGNEEELPVDSVSWDDCQELCKRLSRKEGRRYRLPTEAEWEYACRAGTATPFWCGDTISTDQANYNGTSAYGKGDKGTFRGRTTPVRRSPPNPWGLYDMHGNLAQWCEDRYGPYNLDAAIDPVNRTGEDIRVLRGGSWGSDPAYCRAAFRNRGKANVRANRMGCRVVLCLD
jgi:formylglycine-generating enzyme required for sulfatase activity